MSEFKDLESLLRLKRYEQPPEGYFENFTESFKERQRAEMLQQSARGLFVERVSTYFWDYGTRHWLMAGGALTAIAATGYWFWSDDAPPKPPIPPAIEAPAPGALPLPGKEFSSE